MTTDETTQPLDVAAIRARADAATEGPWEPGLEIDGVYAGRRTVVRATSGQRLLSVGQTRSHDAERAEANAEFAAHARVDVPALLAEVERLRADVALADAEVKELREDLTDLAQAHAVIDATRQMAIEANARLRAQLLAALGREDDGRTPLSTYVAHLVAQRDALKHALGKGVADEHNRTHKEAK